VDLYSAYRLRKTSNVHNYAEEMEK